MEGKGVIIIPFKVKIFTAGDTETSFGTLRVICLENIYCFRAIVCVLFIDHKKEEKKPIHKTTINDILSNHPIFFP